MVAVTVLPSAPASCGCLLRLWLCNCLCGTLGFMREGFGEGRCRIVCLLCSTAFAWVPVTRGEGRLVWECDKTEAREARQHTFVLHTKQGTKVAARKKKQRCMAHIFELLRTRGCFLCCCHFLAPPFFRALSLNQWLREPLLLCCFFFPLFPFGCQSSTARACFCLGRQLLAHLRGSKHFGTGGIDGGGSSFLVPHNTGRARRRLACPSSA